MSGTITPVWVAQVGAVYPVSMYKAKKNELCKFFGKFFLTMGWKDGKG